MQQFIDSFLIGLSTQFYILQIVTIFLLVLYGVIFVLVIRGNNMSVWDYLLAYPISLLMYSIAGYFILSVGIPFNRYSVPFLMIVILAMVVVLFRNNIKKSMFLTKRVLIYIGAIMIFALICTSGFIPVSATNDSMYFFSEYPRALVFYGRLNSFLDNFLTDASQGISIIGTLPFFYGFDEIFGIQLLFNLNFIVFYVYAVYDYSIKKIEKKVSVIVTGISFLMLVTSMPFALMSKWLMANMFFMEYMLIAVYLAYKFCENTNKADLIILSVMITGLSIMRMEGALNAGVLVLCMLILNYKNRDVALFFVSPMLILQALYLYRIFVKIKLHTGIQFMTEEKAIVLISFLICVMIYVLVIRNRLFVKMQRYYSWLLMGGFVLVNIEALLYSRSKYIINIKAFIGNVLRNSGWGLMASVIIGILLLIPKKSIKINYFDITVICYVLLTIVTGLARGDTLYQSFGDSGNRILIQVVPTLLFAITVKIVEGLEYWKKEKLSLME